MRGVGRTGSVRANTTECPVINIHIEWQDVADCGEWNDTTSVPLQRRTHRHQHTMFPLLKQGWKCIRSL